MSTENLKALTLWRLRARLIFTGTVGGWQKDTGAEDRRQGQGGRGAEDRRQGRGGTGAIPSLHNRSRKEIPPHKNRGYRESKPIIYDAKSRVYGAKTAQGNQQTATNKRQPTDGKEADTCKRTAI